MALLQSSIESGLLRAPSQEIPPKQIFIGMKRKAVSENLPDQACQGNCDQRLLPEQLKGRPAPLQQFQLQQPLEQFQNHHPSMEQLPKQKPSPQRLNGKHLPTQEMESLRAFPEHSQNPQPLFRHSQGQQLLLQQSDSQQSPPNQIGSFWCNICKTNCGNAFNLKCHFQGKKHKAKLDEVFGCTASEPNGNEVKRRKNTRRCGSNNSTPSNLITYFWCNLCKVDCGNAFNLECHCQGKKHRVKCDQVYGSKNTIPDRKKVSGRKKTTSRKPKLL